MKLFFILLALPFFSCNNTAGEGVALDSAAYYNGKVHYYDSLLRDTRRRQEDLSKAFDVSKAANDRTAALELYVQNRAAFDSSKWLNDSVILYMEKSAAVKK